ncbi:hypothetical protein [Allorhizobium terrae]|uniref:hypothetical protein n=1 Tax=Allorhizobium terrae TaxID=1848972 RepID=UPI0011AD5399|nr:hypothetical protein [Allorhizobium terrae]TWD46946.1 hypothetical protein FB480_11115 [Agrobacterium vitis]
MVDIAKRLTAISVIMTLFALLFLAMINDHNPAARMRQQSQISATYGLIPSA